VWSFVSRTQPGARTPYAMVADNDLGLGRIVDTIFPLANLELVGDLRRR
jgi:hypothetical protein